MIRDALERGFRDISIAIGGSATNDGGIGCIRALGGRFLDENGEELKGCGGDLIKIKKIDISGLNPLIKECRFTVMCDVTNPLCGKDGATYTFGRQKAQHLRFRMNWKKVCVTIVISYKSNLAWIWIT